MTGNGSNNNPPEDLPPSYDEVIAQELHQQLNGSPAGASSGSQHHQSEPVTNSLSSNRPTSSRPTSSRPTSSRPTSSKPTSSKPTSSLPSYSRPPPVKPNDQRPTQSLSSQKRYPWVYPQGYWCPKCQNTGYKIKNGKSCKACWERFGRQNSNVHVIGNSYAPNTNYGLYRPPYSQAVTTIAATPVPIIPNGLPPRIVKPGDPSIGGVLCGRCRGSGLTHFFLDEEICTVCKGVGRILS